MGFIVFLLHLRENFLHIWYWVFFFALSCFTYGWKSLEIWENKNGNKSYKWCQWRLRSGMDWIEILSKYNFHRFFFSIAGIKIQWPKKMFYLAYGFRRLESVMDKVRNSCELPPWPTPMRQEWALGTIPQNPGPSERLPPAGPSFLILQKQYSQARTKLKYMS